VTVYCQLVQSTRPRCYRWCSEHGAVVVDRCQDEDEDEETEEAVGDDDGAE